MKFLNVKLLGALSNEYALKVIFARKGRSDDLKSLLLSL